MNVKPAKGYSEAVYRKREVAKRKIIVKVTPLFLDKGFDKTTIKDIETVTGLKAGSIYNLFENKTDILNGCSVLIYESIIRESREKAGKNAGSLHSVAYPMILELYAAASNPVLATLLDNGSTNSSSNNLMRMRAELTAAYLKKNGYEMEPGKMDIRLVGLSGAMNRYISNYLNNPHTTCRDESVAMVTMFGALFGIPKNEDGVEKVVDGIITYLKNDCKDLEKRLLTVS